MLQRVPVSLRRAALSRRRPLRIAGNGIVPFVRAENFFAATCVCRWKSRPGIVPFVRRKNFFSRGDAAENRMPARRASLARRCTIAPVPPRIAVSDRRAAPAPRRRNLFSYRVHVTPPHVFTADSCMGSRKSRAAICTIFPCFAALCSVLQCFAADKRQLQLGSE